MNVPKIKLTFPESIGGYWDYGKKSGGIFTCEDKSSYYEKHPGPGSTIKWGCWELNFWFNAGSGKSWLDAAKIAQRRLNNLCKVPGATTEIIWENPRRALTEEDANEEEARELLYYIKNDQNLYNQTFIPIVKNMMKKRAKGIFDHEKAVKGFMHLVDEGWHRYRKEYDMEDIGGGFNIATRRAVARKLVDEFITEADLGNYDEMMKKRIKENPRSGSILYDIYETTEGIVSLYFVKGDTVLDDYFEVRVDGGILRYFDSETAARRYIENEFEMIKGHTTKHHHSQRNPYMEDTIESQTIHAIYLGSCASCVARALKLGYGGAKVRCETLVGHGLLKRKNGSECPECKRITTVYYK